MRTTQSLVALLSLASVAALPALGAVGCSSTETDVTPRADGGSNGPILPFEEPATACADTEESIYGAPGDVAPMDASQRGAIVRCAKGADVSLETIQSRLSAVNFAGGPVTSGARVYRVLYRTERGDAANTLGFSSAIVFVPTVPRANDLPVIVSSRGTTGQAPNCAISKNDPNNPDSDAFVRNAFPLVGFGYTVIVPDLAGYANYGAAGNPPSGYAQFADVGKSTLDGSRALKQLFPQLADKTVLVGHSQGGHSALSALSLADSYGAAGPIVGAAVYAPLWLSQRSWGAILERGVAESMNFSIDDTGLPNAVSVWYHYTEAELLDGPGEGAKLFRPEKQEAIKSFVDSVCINDTFPELKAAAMSEGQDPSVENYAYQLFSEEFVTQIGAPAAFGSPCTPGSLCEKWIGRYSADRPHLTGSALQTPILLVYGGEDKTITPDRMKCALDRLKKDKSSLRVCYEPGPDHSTIIDARGAYVADWIGSVALGEEDPGACSKDEKGIDTRCAIIPPND